MQPHLAILRDSNGVLASASNLPNLQVSQSLDEAKVRLERMATLVLREALRATEAELPLEVSATNVKLPAHCKRRTVTPPRHHLDDILRETEG